MLSGMYFPFCSRIGAIFLPIMRVGVASSSFGMMPNSKGVFFRPKMLRDFTQGGQ